MGSSVRCRSESKKAHHVTSIVTTTLIPDMPFSSLEKGVTITAAKIKVGKKSEVHDPVAHLPDRRCKATVNDLDMNRYLKADLILVLMGKLSNRSKQTHTS